MGKPKEGFICLNYNQARQIVNMFGGEDADITIEYFEDAWDGPGLYAYYTEYPEEGLEPLDPTYSIECEPWRNKPPQFFARPLEAVTYDCYAIYDTTSPTRWEQSVADLQDAADEHMAQVCGLSPYGEQKIGLNKPELLEPLASMIKIQGPPGTYSQADAAMQQFAASNCLGLLAQQ